MPSQAFHLEKLLLSGWVGLGVGWSRPLGNQGGAYRVSQAVGDSDVCCRTVALCGQRAQKSSLFTALSGRKLSPSSHPDARHFSSSPYATGALQGAALVLEPKGSESE